MAKRLTTTTINWGGLIEHFSQVDRSALSAFKSKIDKYAREIASQPSELPKIDWGFYKSRIATPGMVDSFQKNYESLKVPYPTDQGLVAEAESFSGKFIKKYEAHFAQVRSQIESQTKALAEKEKMIPYTQMTMEEFYLARPELRIDPDNPKFWPEALTEKQTKKVEDKH